MATAQHPLEITGKKPSRLASLMKRKDVLYIFVFGLFAVSVWVGLSVYFSLHKTTIPPLVKKQAIPLNPVIDAQALELLKQRTLYTQDQLSSFTVSKQEGEGETSQKGTPSPSPTPKPSPSPSPAPTASPSATTP